MRDYQVICRYSVDDSAYLAYAPEYPGCVADGETPKKAIEELDVVVGMWRDIAKKDGIDISNHKVETFAKRDISIDDVASYILTVKKKATTYQLQKWLYYCKAWSEAWGGNEFFNGDFVKFKDGPVNWKLFHELQGAGTVREGDVVGKVPLNESEKRLVDSILEVYGDMSGDELSNQTHMEEPWKEVDKNQKINPERMREYYSSLIS